MQCTHISFNFINYCSTATVNALDQFALNKNFPQILIIQNVNCRFD